MENSTLFLAYLITWCGYLIALYVLGRRRQLHRGGLFGSQIVPSLIAVLMVAVFVVGRGSTVAQLVSGSEQGLNLWRLWLYLWPLLLLGAGLSTAAHFVWTGVSCFRPIHRKWIAVSTSGAFMSAFGFLTVISNFPDA